MIEPTQDRGQQEPQPDPQTIEDLAPTEAESTQLKGGYQTGGSGHSAGGGGGAGRV